MRSSRAAVDRVDSRVAHGHRSMLVTLLQVVFSRLKTKIPLSHMRQLEYERSTCTMTQNAISVSQVEGSSPGCALGSSESEGVADVRQLQALPKLRQA